MINNRCRGNVLVVPGGFGEPALLRHRGVHLHLRIFDQQAPMYDLRVHPDDALAQR